MDALVDCHAHLYPSYFTAEACRDLLATSPTCPALVVAVTECRADWQALQDWLSHPATPPAMSKRVVYCVGVHPMQRAVSNPEGGSVRTVRIATDLDDDAVRWLAEAVRDDPRVVGVGEVGLDYSPHVLATHPDGPEAARAEQRQVLVAQLAIARRHGVAVNVHSRQAGRHVLEVLRETGYTDGGGGVLLHAFDGRPKYIAEGLALGAYFSVAPSLARDAQLERLVRLVPLTRLVLESDAPALSAVRGECSTPQDIAAVCQRIADIKQVTVEEVAAATTANAHVLFPRLATQSL